MQGWGEPSLAQMNVAACRSDTCSKGRGCSVEWGPKPSDDSEGAGRAKQNRENGRVEGWGDGWLGAEKGWREGRVQQTHGLSHRPAHGQLIVSSHVELVILLTHIAALSRCWGIAADAPATHKRLCRGEIVLRRGCAEGRLS
eukprot:357335-Chlamydomonas_euryale.AAC.5